MGVDFNPSIVELRKAIDEPTDIEKPKLRCEEVIDDWIKKN